MVNDLRPFEMIKKQVEDERRRVIEDAPKRQVIEERIRLELELRRAEDIEILKAFILIGSNSTEHTEILRRKVEIDFELGE